jgi:peptide/nickel transport system permease protein
VPSGVRNDHSVEAQRRCKLHTRSAKKIVDVSAQQTQPASDDAPAVIAELTPSPGLWGLAMRRLLRERSAVFSALVLLVVIVIAMFAPVTAPYDPNQQFRKEGLSKQGQPVSPNAKFLAGTDGVGRDLMSRIIWGARVSLSVGFIASLISTVIALLIGGAAGMIGGSVDSVIMRFVDLMMSVPVFFLQLLLVAVFRPSPIVTIAVIVLFGWAGASRVFRAEVSSLVERDYIAAARALGMSTFDIFTRHIVPQLLPLIIVYVSLSIPGAIFAEAGLSFLNLGIPPPTATWGAMIQDGKTVSP